MNKKEKKKIWNEIPFPVKEAISNNYGVNVEEISQSVLLHDKVASTHQYFTIFNWDDGKICLYSYKDKTELIKLCQELLQENEINYCIFDRQGNQVEIKIKEIEVG